MARRIQVLKRETGGGESARRASLSFFVSVTKRMTKKRPAVEEEGKGNRETEDVRR